jgi:L-ribulokinase
MSGSFIIGLDYGSESARGVLIDTVSGEQIASHAREYRHGVMTRELPDGSKLPRAWALQNAADYLEAAEEILAELGRGRTIESIGIGFTASSPMPTTEDGVALSQILPSDPHAYVKLWKHSAAQSYADSINAKGGAFLDNFGGKLAGEWLFAKAAQIAAEAPSTWEKAGRFIESGDWLVWQLTGTEARSLSFAAYKAQYSEDAGYPERIVPGLAAKLSPPLRIGSPGGQLTEEWRARTGIEGAGVVAVAVIDAHVVLPAIGAVSSGCFVGALGTSAGYLFLNEEFRPLPSGIEGVARDSSVRDLWCYEAGQASFGDMLSWFVDAFPRADSMAENFRLYNKEAAEISAGANHLVAIDWWRGNRVPFADCSLSGLLLGLTMASTAVDIYRALMEALCYGAKSVVDLLEAADFHIERILMTSGLAQNNPLLVQIMADVMERCIEVPEIANPTAVGAAIHGAVAAGLVAGYSEGAARFGARTFKPYQPRAENAAAYRALYQNYRELCAIGAVRDAMHALNQIVPASRASDAYTAETKSMV